MTRSDMRAVQRTTPQSQIWLDFFKDCSSRLLVQEDFTKLFRKKWNEKYVKPQLVLEAWVAAHPPMYRLNLLEWSWFDSILREKKFTDKLVLDLIRKRLSASLAHYLEGNFSPYRWRFNPKFDEEWLKTIEGQLLKRLAHEMEVNSHLRYGPIDQLPVEQICKSLCLLLQEFAKVFQNVDSLQGPALEIGLYLAGYTTVFIKTLYKLDLLNIGKDGGPPETWRRWFGKHLPPLINLLTATNGDIAQNLSDIQSESGLFDLAGNDQITNNVQEEMDTLRYQNNIIDGPVTTSRVALYIYLNAMLVGRPGCDDQALFSFLNTRYGQNISQLVTDLITASFDTYANAINRAEPGELLNVYRSFLINKVPLIIASYVPLLNNFAPVSMESCITDALSRMDPSADPYAPQAFDPLSVSGMVSESRQEFLFACALHGMIPESSIETILGDLPMDSLPESGKYTKEILNNRCDAKSGRLEELVGELEQMDGNSGAIAELVVENISKLCIARDTIALKNLCNALIKKPQSLNVLLLFAQLSDVLNPLCELLDHWQDQEDSNEHQPIYEEFGSIFMLVLLLQHQFDVDMNETGISYPNSFILKYARVGHQPRYPELSDAERKNLSGWIKGLYDEGSISDDLMSSCTPKDFHLFVATLFQQSLAACEHGILGLDTLKGGFEYLLLPFLLPSLVTALRWFAARLWTTQSENFRVTDKGVPMLDKNKNRVLENAQTARLEILLPALKALLKPSSLPSESQSLHEVVLVITAKPLERSLLHVQKLYPRRTDVEPLLSVLKQRIKPQRTDSTTPIEYEAWFATPNGGMQGSIRQCVRSLSTWSISGSASAAPPKYTHRQILVAVQVDGATKTLDNLVTEILTQSSVSGSVDVILDIVTAILCAQPGRSRGRLTLRDVLDKQYKETYALSKTDAPRAEIIVRLAKRVAAQSFRPHQQSVGANGAGEMLMDMGTSDSAGIAGMTGMVDMGADVGGVAQDEYNAMLSGAMDLGMDGGFMATEKELDDMFM